MAALDLVIPEELYRSALEDDDDDHDKGPSDCKCRESEYGEAHPPDREDTKVEEENGQNDKANGRTPRNLYHKKTLTVGEK